MLKPATPLTILLLVAFALLLVSVITTPLVKGIPLASFNGVDYGVFGCCKGSQCSGIKIGYDGSLCANLDQSNFSLPSGARHSLSSILIVHPVAGLLTLVCFIMAATAHLHAPSHSGRYLLALTILLLPTLLITLLAFLVDILLFAPHLKWGGWIVLASTILIAISGVVSCAMRRTLVSRKARKKRIAQNAEMNGENFYSRQNTIKDEAARADSPPPLSQQHSAPMVNGAPGGDKLPSFATFDVNKARRSEDDQTPLNARSPSNRTLPSSNGYRTDDGMDRYGGPGRGGSQNWRGGRGGRGYNGPRDEFGNPLPPSAAFGPGPGSRDPSRTRNMPNQYPDDTMNAQGSRGRMRGGPGPPRGYGRGDPYGGRGRGGPGMNGNGGRGGGIPMGPMMAGAGAGMMAGEMMPGRGQRVPPPGYGNGYGPSPRPSYDQPRGPPVVYDREKSPAAYNLSPGQYGGRRPSPGPPSAPAPGYPGQGVYGYEGGQRRQSYERQRRSPGPGSPGAQQRFRDDQPLPPMPVPNTEYGHDYDPEGVAPIGQAVEMDAATGSPSHTPGFAAPPEFRDSDSDMQGLVGLQQNRQASSPTRGHDTLQSASSTYSGQPEPYVPARAAWRDPASSSTRANVPPPLNHLDTNTTISTTNTAPPIELPAHRTPQPPSLQQSFPLPPTHSNGNGNGNGSRHNRGPSADNYYEDVLPEFAVDDIAPGPLQPGNNPNSNSHSHSYSSAPAPLPNRNLYPQSPGGHLQPSNSYENVHDLEDAGGGGRSPQSEGSNFTSVSQRGVNPNYPDYDGSGYGYESGHGYGYSPNRDRNGGDGGGGYGNGGGGGGNGGIGMPNRKPAPLQQQQQRDILLDSNPDFGVPGTGRGRGGGGGRGPSPMMTTNARGGGVGGMGGYGAAM